MTSLSSVAAIPAVLADGVVAVLTGTLAAALLLTKELLLLLVLLAVVELIHTCLELLLRLLIFLISISLASLVYVAVFLVHAARMLLAEPLQNAVVWQQRSMQLMNDYLLESE